MNCRPSLYTLYEGYPSNDFLTLQRFFDTSRVSAEDDYQNSSRTDALNSKRLLISSQDVEEAWQALSSAASMNADMPLIRDELTGVEPPENAANSKLAKLFHTDVLQVGKMAQYRFDFLCQCLQTAMLLELSSYKAAIFYTVASKTFDFLIKKSRNFMNIGKLADLRNCLNFSRKLLLFYCKNMTEEVLTFKEVQKMLNFFQRTLVKHWMLYQFCIAFNDMSFPPPPVVAADNPLESMGSPASWGEEMAVEMNRSDKQETAKLAAELPNYSSSNQRRPEGGGDKSQRRQSHKGLHRSSDASEQSVSGGGLAIMKETQNNSNKQVKQLTSDIKEMIGEKAMELSSMLEKLNG